MNHTRDRKAIQLFEQAMGMPSDKVAAFLDASCGDDKRLRAEVDALLSTQEEADDFLAAPSRKDLSTGVGVSDETNAQRTSTNTLRLRHGEVLVNRYAIIGTGGMGEVYRATDARLDRDVAIKVLNTASQYSDEMQERFEREMRSIAALSHPNVMILHDIADQDDMRFAIMEFVEGKTLRQIIDDGLDWQTTINIAHEIALGLGAAHALDIMHRDIKPDNVIVSENGPVKVLDFGLARRETVLEDQELTVGELAPGTIPYMSPEQADGKELTCATDIFSFGIVLFEMLAGVNPFRADNALQTLRRISDAKASVISSFVSGLPDELISLVSAMLHQDPSRRPSAKQIAETCSRMRNSPGSSSTAHIRSTPTNLSRRPTELTGRDREIRDITFSLVDHPIVTIVGPGGVGKTSIAMEVAHATRRQFPGGVWFCEFAPVRKSEDVADVLMSVLDGNAGSKGILDQIVAKLHGKPTMLVLDNCEHLIDAVAELAETLSQRVSGLTILATSREALSVDREYVSRLEGLGCDGVASDAANLFVAKAKSQAGYEDDPLRRDVVQQIVIEASDSFDKARKLAQQSGDEVECRWTSLAIGACARTMANPNDPRVDEMLSDGDEYVSKLDWPTGNAWQALAAGTAPMTRREMQAALDHRNRAIEFAMSCGNRWIELIARLVVSDSTDPSVPAPSRLESAITNLRSLIDVGEEAHYPLAARNVVVALVACGQIESGVRCSTTAESLLGVGDKNEFTPHYPATISDMKESLGKENFQRLRREGKSFKVRDIAELAEQVLAAIDVSGPTY